MTIEHSDLQQMSSLARSCTMENLVGALCMMGLSHTVDMMSDCLHDEDYVNDNGMPTMESIVGQASCHICHVIPDIVLDNDLFDDNISTVVEDGGSALEMLFTAMLKQIVKQTPQLAKIEFIPR